MPLVLIEELPSWVADALGWIGLAISLIGTQVPSRTGIFACDMGASVANALHFFLRGNSGGMESQTMSFIAAVFGAVSTMKRFAWVYTLLYPMVLYAGFSAATEHGYLEALPQLTVLMSLIGKQSSSMLTLRLLVLLSCIPSTLYGVVTASVPYTTSSLIFTCFSVFSLYKERSSVRNKEA